MTTTVKLTPALARFVDQKVEAGEYPDVETLLNEALREKAERDVTYQPWADVHIEQALLDVRSGTAKYANLKVVSAWMKSWGMENELQKPVCA